MDISGELASMILAPALGWLYRFICCNSVYDSAIRFVPQYHQLLKMMVKEVLDLKRLYYFAVHNTSHSHDSVRIGTHGHRCCFNM